MLLRTPKDIGAVMRATRRRLGLDQATVAERAGVSRLWLIEVERGKPGAEVGLVLRALRVLGIALRVDADASPDAVDVHTPDIDAVIDAARSGDP